LAIQINKYKSIDLDKYADKEKYPDYIESVYEYNITKGFTSIRIDKYLTQVIENSTRTRVQKAMDAGRVEVNGEVLTKSNYKIRPGDNIKCTILKSPPMDLRPENIPLDVVYEDEYLLVVNKPTNMVVHPGLGNRYGTLVNALLYHFGNRTPLQIEFDEEEDVDEATIEGKLMASDKVRPGIVHRIDKDTSGIIVVAKNNDILTKLQKQFAAHTTERTYYALTWGRFKQDSGAYEGDVGRHPRNRKLFWVVNKGGKSAKTNYKVVERYEFAALLQLKLHTGRTHQIRIHCSYDKHPLIGDKDYGGDKFVYGKTVPEYRQGAQKVLALADRQMLHAKTLGFIHPATNEFMQFDSELPEDFKEIIKVLRSVNVDRSRMHELI
jgi:23S rRNA pseudouridine1911/1915/1917 synthase